MSAPDPRLNAFRADLADARLADRVTADAYTTPARARTIARATIVRRRPDPTLARETELLLGEPVKVFERRDGWAWIQSDMDDYVGYVPEDALAEGVPTPTHRVSALTSPVHPEPTLKTLPKPPLGFGDLVTVQEQDKKWSRIGPDAWLYSAHLTALSAGHPGAPDPVSTALRFLEVPYVWGGRQAQGLDCSALIQFALKDWGLPCPRDSDQQEQMLGALIAEAARASGLERNDLVFWPGHVGMMIDPHRIVHANATDMAVRVWDLDALEAHIQRIEGTPISSIRRLDLAAAAA